MSSVRRVRHRLGTPPESPNEPAAKKRKYSSDKYNVIQSLDAPAPKIRECTPDKYSLIDNIRHLIDSDSLYDIIFIVGSGNNIKQFKCLRALFAVQSTIFKLMLYGNFAESKCNRIVIRDINPDAFDYIRKVFYARKPKITSDIAMDVLYASHVYLLPRIQGDIIRHIVYSKDVKYCPLFLKYSKLEFFQSIFEHFIKWQPLESIQNMLLNKHGHVTISQARYMIETKIKNYEIRYQLIKLYCMNYQLYTNSKCKNYYKDWQQVFILHFRTLIRFDQLCPQILFDEVKKDKVLSPKELLECINAKTKFSNGFRGTKWLLSKQQIKQLQVSDEIIYFRHDYHAWFHGVITQVGKQFIQVTNKSRNTVFNMHYNTCSRIMRNNHIMLDKRERLSDINVGNKVYILVEQTNELSRWTEMKIISIQDNVYAVFKHFKIHLNDIDSIKSIDIKH